MATIRKRGDAWQVEVRMRGVYECRTFPSRAAAKEWGIRREAEIHDGRSGAIPDKHFGDAVKRYRDQVSIGKKGAAWEVKRLNALLVDPVATVPLRELSSTHVAEWRDRRMQTVSGSTVNREWNLLSHVCTIAVKEWRWLRENPFSNVRRPAQGKPRDRLPTAEEIEELKIAAGYPGPGLSAKVIAAFLFACETGMRMSEICALERIEGRVAKLEDTKNGDARAVPLSAEALRLWQESGPFHMEPSRMEALWRKIRGKTSVEGLRYHDSRHYAATRLAQKLHVLDLCRVMGWRNPKQAMVYYNLSAEDIAGKL